MQRYLVMQDGNTHSIIKDLPHIECFQCGECCVRYRPMLLETDITRMARELSISKDVFFSKYVRVMPDRESFILDSGEKQCPFLSWDQEFSKSICLVYQSRPLACRDFIASLSRHECQEGLKKLRSEMSILLPRDLYSSKNERKQLYSVLREIED